jgi:ribosomal-protein-alanine N-acetyltransferase
LLNPGYRYHAALDEEGVRAGYFCFGDDARVPSGEEPGLYEEDALDVGLGMRPDLIGKGMGEEFVRVGLAFARECYSPASFRLTVAAINRRAIRVYEKVGFTRTVSFTGNGREWVVMAADARSARLS